jgi:hypothetical protein
MKTHLRIALGVFAGFGLGALTVAGANAQAAPPVYEADRMLGPHRRTQPARISPMRRVDAGSP